MSHKTPAERYAERIASLAKQQMELLESIPGPLLDDVYEALLGERMDERGGVVEALWWMGEHLRTNAIRVRDQRGL